MDKMSVDIQGVKKTIKMFKSFGIEGEKEVEEITKIAAFDVEVQAKKLAAVDTSYMKNHIAAEKKGDLRWTITSYAIYSIWQEFGKRNPNYPFKPFLYPAWRQGVKSYVKNLKQGLKKLTRKYNN